MDANNLEKLDALNKTVLFSVWLYQKVEKFDRRYKYTLGDRIIHYCDSAQERLLEANACIDKGKAAKKIYDALTCIDMLSIKTRIACDVGALSIRDKAICDIELGKIKESSRCWRSYFLRIAKEKSKRQNNGEGEGGQEPPSESQE